MDVISYDLNNCQRLSIEKDRLTIQAKILFPIENEYLKLNHLPNNAKILDLGCGNGSYLFQIKQNFPLFSTLGAEKNDTLIQIARDNFQVECVKFDILECKKLENIIDEFDPDCVLIRFVLQHLSRSQILDLLSVIHYSKKQSCCVCVIDTDDQRISIQDSDVDVDYVLKRKAFQQSNRGGDRYIGSKLEGIFKETGFRIESNSNIQIRSSVVGIKPWMEVFEPIILSEILPTEHELRVRVVDTIERIKQKSAECSWGLTILRTF